MQTRASCKLLILTIEITIHNGLKKYEIVEREEKKEKQCDIHLGNKTGNTNCCV